MSKAISWTLKKVLPFFCLLFSCSAVFAQDEVDYSIHANIIYHFTKYVDWPSSKKSGDFVIGVVGDTPLLDELKKSVVGKKAGSQNIVVKRFSSSAQAFACHILFVSDDVSNNIKKIASTTANEPVLIVSESPGLALKGSCINFCIIDERLKLQINKFNIQQRGLGIATELLQLAIQVK